MTLSLATMQDMLAAYSSRVLVECVTITVEGDDPLYFVNDTTDLVRTISGVSTTFIAFPFQVALHNDEDDQLPEAVLTIDAVDQTIIALLREAASTVPEVKIEVVARAAPDTVDAGPFVFKMTGAETDGVSTVRIHLGFGAQYLSAAFPAAMFSQANAGT